MSVDLAGPVENLQKAIEASSNGSTQLTANAPINALPQELLENVFSFAGNTGAISQVSREFRQATPIANQQIYESLASSNTFLGQLIKQPASPFVLLPQSTGSTVDCTRRLKHVKKEAIEILSKDLLFMREKWQPILGQRQLSQLSYNELNELARILQEERDENLVSFIEGFASIEFRLEEDGTDINPMQPVLEPIAHLSLSEKAAEIRRWIKTEAGMQILQEFCLEEVNLDEVNVENRRPPEAYFLGPESQEVLLEDYIRQKDAHSLIDYFRKPWKIEGKTPEQIKENLLIKMLAQLSDLDIEMLIALKKDAGFEDLNFNNHPDIIELLLEQLKNLPLTKLHADFFLECSSFPTSGSLFLFVLMRDSVQKGDWDGVRQLLNHPKASELSNLFPFNRPYADPDEPRNQICFGDRLSDLCQRCKQAGQNDLAEFFGKHSRLWFPLSPSQRGTILFHRIIKGELILFAGFIVIYYLTDLLRKAFPRDPYEIAPGFRIRPYQESVERDMLKLLLEIQRRRGQ